MLRLLASALLFGAPALAAPPDDSSEDEDLFEDLLGDDEDELEEQEAPDRLDEADEQPVDDENLDQDARDAEDEQDLLEGDDDPAAPSGDSEAIYRQQARELEGLPSEDVVEGWRSYLARYPQTPFRNRIEATIEEEMEALYSQDVERIDDGPVVDADKAELAFSQSMILENINPRTRLQAGFEWGLPDYINLFADYEHQLIRSLSVHAGVRHRYTGWSIEPGVRWAMVKSARTHTFLTLIGDVHVNANPAFVGFRPQLAFGKRFFEKLDFQLHAGADVEARKFAAVRIIGGTSLVYRAARTVGLFAEANANVKGPFRFNVISFGMKFYPGPKNKPDQMELNMGAQVPYATNYTQYHFGSVTGQFNYYL